MSVKVWGGPVGSRVTPTQFSLAVCDVRAWSSGDADHLGRVWWPPRTQVVGESDHTYNADLAFR